MLTDNLLPGTRFTQTNEGVALFYDESRGKPISMSRLNISFGINNKNITGNRWLQTTGNIPSNILGYKIPRNAIITAITAQSKNASNCDFYIKRNNSEDVLYSFNLNSEDKVVDDLNIDVNAGDFIQIELSTNSSIDYPLILVEIAWR